jgi:iron complex outermembrane recepter protein
MHTKKIWIERLLAVGCLTHVAMAAADAEGPPADATGSDVLATVVVTGSNVRGSAENPIAPLQVLDREQLTQGNALQFNEILQNVPANTGSALYNESGQLSGTAQFALRGLGYSSTLVLVNGRRAGVSPLSDKSGSDFLDINQFPLSMVERVEVLKDGASAIYGSEAVAGVVNIITRRGFEGFELSTDYQSASNRAYSVSLATGVAFDRGSFNLYATYLDQTGNSRSDFDWLMERVGGNGVRGRSQLLSTNGYPGTFSRASFNAAGQPVLATGAVGASDPNCEAAGGVFRINDNGTVNTNLCHADFTDQIAIIPEQRRMQAFAEFTYELADGVSFFNETSVSSNLNLLDSTVGGFTNGAGADNAKGFAYVPANHPFNFFVASPSDPRRIVYIDPNQWNPAVHQAVDVVGSLRPEGVNRSGDKRQKNDYLRTANGVNWELSDYWETTVSHGYAQARFEENDPMGVNAQVLNNLLLSGAYNPFGTSIVDPDRVSPKDGTTVAANSDATLSQIFYTANTTRRTDQHVVNASLSGPVVSMAGGDIAMAVGAQYRDLRLKVTPDSLFAAGGGTVSTVTSGFEAQQDVAAGYLETIVPFHDRAQVQLAVRHEDYGGAVGSSTDPKVAGRVAIIDGLALRGSWGTSFQAPTLTQQSTTTTRSIVNDPVIVGANGQLTCGSTTRAGNALVQTSGSNLEPQQSENFNLGLDVTPLDALTFSGDYWRYRYSNLIAAAQNGQAVVSGECGTGQFIADPRVVRSPGGLIEVINSDYVNVGKVITDGVDLSAVYRFPTGPIGSFTLRADSTYTNKFDVYGANGVVTDKVGNRNFTNNFAPMPRWRATGTAAWSLGAHSAAVSMHFTDSYRNDQSNNAPIASYTTFDVQYGLNLTGLLGEDSSSTLTIGVDNVLDEDPPALVRYTATGELVTGIASVDRPGYDALSGVDIRGRIVYAKFLQQF